MFFRISFTHLLFPIYLILKTRRRIKIRASNKKEEKNETNNTTAQVRVRVSRWCETTKGHRKLPWQYAAYLMYMQNKKI